MKDLSGDDFDRMMARLKTIKITKLPDDFEPSKDEAEKIANAIP